MKAFEVKKKVRGGHKDQTRTVFVAANSKKELQQDPDFIQAWMRPDIEPEECPMVFSGRWIDPR